MTHKFNFFRAGGFNQVRFDTGEDLFKLDELDQKLWVALACPTQGLMFDNRTLDLIDTDRDGRIRAGELIAAVKWAGRLLNDRDDLIKAPAELPLLAINTHDEEGQQVLKAAKAILQSLGKGDASSISVEDTAHALEHFNALPFNGDGVITTDAASDPEIQALIADILATVGDGLDRSGKPGIDADHTALFFQEVADYLSWFDQSTTDTALLPLQDNTGVGFAALQTLRSKIDDYFVRCQVAAFDARAIAALNREEKEYYALTARDLDISADEIRCLPLAHVDASRPLPLVEGINPAWAVAMGEFVRRVVTPVLGDLDVLQESQWQQLKAIFAPYERWQGDKPATTVEKLGIERLRAVMAPTNATRLGELFAREKEQAVTASAIASVERLLRYVRDLHKLAMNFVSFQQFYQRQSPAIFQAGTLYLDQRTCELCVRVNDVAKHAAMAPLSRAYLAYCDCSRPATGEKMTIAAAFTDGDADNLVVGRNGIFYDREGKDWDATITKLVENPISLRQAFWSPYKKLIRFIEQQVAKRAAASDAASQSLLTDTATQVGSAAETGKSDAVAPKKIDVGVVAALGVAVGGITAALGALLQTFFGLGVWMPLGLIGLLLVISGPSMLIAWLKLRQRNVGPLLDANGWAVNANALVNVPFGGSLTKVATLPKGSKLDTFDPFAEKKTPWRTYTALALVVLLALAWVSGLLDGLLPESVRSVAVFASPPVITPEAIVPQTNTPQP